MLIDNGKKYSGFAEVAINILSYQTVVSVRKCFRHIFSDSTFAIDFGTYQKKKNYIHAKIPNMGFPRTFLEADSFFCFACLVLVLVSLI